MNAGITDSGELLFSGPRVGVLSSASHAFDFLELEAFGGFDERSRNDLGSRAAVLYQKYTDLRNLGSGIVLVVMQVPGTCSNISNTPRVNPITGCVGGSNTRKS